MKALVKHCRGYGAQLENITIPIINDEEVLIKVKATSICGTDIHIYTWDEWAAGRVNPPYVFGHEFSGEVAKIGSKVKSVKPGDFVSAETHIVCGRCPQCLSGKFHICKHTKIIGVDTQGCFAEYVVLPEGNLWKNPEDMPYDVASLQEPMGNAVHTVLAGEIAGMNVAVIGCGPIGMMAVCIAKAAGASKIYAFDVNDYRLAIAKKLGAAVVINSAKQDPIKIVQRLTHGNGVDVVCEMSGHPTAINQGFKMVTNGGRVSILSLPSMLVEIDFTEDIVFKGITVQGITGREMFKTWQQVSGLLNSGQVDVKPIITHHFPLEDYKKAFDLMIKGNCGKIVLYP
ncbi:L-threonine 3-dehydrogenase [Bacillus sp. V5-8f]|nr:L-threonine 3-dehydrogenase [Bacillus sp. V5-8f]